MSDDLFNTIYNKSLDLLSRREHSFKEIKDKLSARFENKKIIETGNILFANLILSGQDNSLYYFDNPKSFGHYDKSGKSVKKALMKTPIMVQDYRPLSEWESILF